MEGALDDAKVSKASRMSKAATVKPRHTKPRIRKVARPSTKRINPKSQMREAAGDQVNVPVGAMHLSEGGAAAAASDEEQLHEELKVSVFVTEDGHTIFKSEYLEGACGQEDALMPGTPLDRALPKSTIIFVDLLCKRHDIYIASSNCTQLALDRPTRALRLAEIWKQLTWLERQIKKPCMSGARVSRADVTWYPTAIFMEFVLPRVFGWPAVFHETTHFPKVTAWFEYLGKAPIFAAVHEDIWNYWVQEEKDGQFDHIRDEIQDLNFKWKYP